MLLDFELAHYALGGSVGSPETRYLSCVALAVLTHLTTYKMFFLRVYVCPPGSCSREMQFSEGTYRGWSGESDNPAV